MKALGHIADLFRYFPGKFGDELRKLLYSSVFKKMGKDVQIKDGVVILNPENISIGDHSGINQHCYLNAFSGIDIGKYVRIAPSVALVSADHGFMKKDVPMSLQESRGKKIIIEDDVWIGYGTVVLKGVRIGQGSVIGANARISKDVPEYSIVVGNGRVVGKRR